MRITVRNLGVLKEAEIDLKPLTVFIGPNNSGKTWLAYTLAGIFGSYGSQEYVQAYIKELIPSIKLLDDSIEQVLTEGSSTIDLYSFSKDYGTLYFNEVATLARSWLSDFFSTQYANFDNLDISLDLSEKKEYFEQRILQFTRRSSIAKGLLTIQKKRYESKVYIYTASEEQDTEEQEEKIGEKIPIEEVKRRVISFISTALHQSLYTWVRIFPTERTTLIATRFSESTMSKEQFQVIDKLRESLSTLVKSPDVAEISTHNAAIREVIHPLGSFLSMLRSIFRVSVKEREARLRNAESNPIVKRYMDLADALEEQVLTGNIEFSTLEPDLRREVLFRPTQSINLEMPIVSSMVKELSPLVLYLRYLAQPGELLIIDEPEMNLHPEAQAKMIEFLAMLVNAGLNVLFTTHSPYITDHLTNLIKANESEEKEAIKDNFFLKRTDAFISKDKVSVYGFGEGTARNALDEDGFINLNTFGEVSDRISNIYFTL